MAAEIGDRIWETFVNQHNSIVSLLDTHASLLVEMRKMCEDKTDTRFLILGRLNTTEKSIATFKQSLEALQEFTKRDDQAEQENSQALGAQVPIVPIRETKKPKSQKPVRAVPDPSGFFTIDPNPTPIEQLYREKTSREKPTAAKSKETPKRKIEVDRPPRAVPAEEEPKQKKSKKTHDRKAPPPASVEDEKEGQSDAQGTDEDDDDSFVKAVAARNKAKEERRQAKAERKRKRQSEDSIEGVSATTTKKKKDKHPTRAETTIPVVAAPASAGTKQKNTQPEKRGFAHAELEEDEADGAFGAAEARKRLRKSKKSKV